MRLSPRLQEFLTAASDEARRRLHEFTPQHVANVRRNLICALFKVRMIGLFDGSSVHADIWCRSYCARVT